MPKDDKNKAEQMIEMQDLSGSSEVEEPVKAAAVKQPEETDINAREQDNHAPATDSTEKKEEPTAEEEKKPREETEQEKAERERLEGMLKKRQEEIAQAQESINRQNATMPDKPKKPNLWMQIMHYLNPNWYAEEFKQYEAEQRSYEARQKEIEKSNQYTNTQIAQWQKESADLENILDTLRQRLLNEPEVKPEEPKPEEPKPEEPKPEEPKQEAPKQESPRQPAQTGPQAVAPTVEANTEEVKQDAPLIDINAVESENVDINAVEQESPELKMEEPQEEKEGDQVQAGLEEQLSKGTETKNREQAHKGTFDDWLKNSTPEQRREMAQKLAAMDNEKEMKQPSSNQPAPQTNERLQQAATLASKYSKGNNPNPATEKRKGNRDAAALDQVKRSNKKVMKSLFDEAEKKGLPVNRNDFTFIEGQSVTSLLEKYEKTFALDKSPKFKEALANHLVALAVVDGLNVEVYPPDKEMIVVNKPTHLTQGNLSALSNANPQRSQNVPQQQQQQPQPQMAAPGM